MGNDEFDLQGGRSMILDPREIARVLEELTERGFVLPFHMAAFGVNGGLLAGTFSESTSGSGLDFRQIAMNAPDPGFLMPINMMFVDARGEAARVVLGRSDQPEVFSLN